MVSTNPIDALAVGVAADFKAEKGKGKGKGGSKAEAAGQEAKAEATAAGATTEEAKALEIVVEDKVAEATQPNEEPATPPAPGDDPQTVFERRLGRLSKLVDEAEFDGGTAFGDLRDCVLDLFKHRPKLWDAMPPSERNDLIRHVEGVCKQVMDKLVLVMAQEDDVTLQATLLPAFNVKGETVEAKIKIENVGEDDVIDLYRLAGHRVVVIDAATKRFMSARRDQDQGRDQAEMPFADPAPRAPREIQSAPPSTEPYTGDDSDLADGADDDAQDDANDAQAGDDWGVFSAGEWLIDENGGEDGWTPTVADAGRWSHDEAKRIAAEFPADGEEIVVRQLGDTPKQTEEPSAS